MRQNLTFLDNFSIGLIYRNKENGRKYNLVRMNGNLGETVSNPMNPSPHYNFHIHKLTENDIEEGNSQTPKFREVIDKYDNFDDAIWYFLDYVRIKDYNEFFPDLNQSKLF